MGIKKRITATLLTAIIAVMSLFVFTGCWDKASDYTEKEHIARVTKLAKKRYIEDGDFTGLEVFPLYDENDKLGFFLIELQPTGYVYVKLNENENYVRSLYTRHEQYESGEVYFAWCRNVIEYGSEMTFYTEDGHIRKEMNRRATELDENGLPIIYTDSHFKVMNIYNERRYVLLVRFGDKMQYIIAVKRNNKYLNLISLEEFEYVARLDEETIVPSYLYFNPQFNL